MKILKIIFVFFLLMNTNCKKDDDDTKTALEQLPQATQTGAQTFGCLIDGKPFIPDSFGSGRPSAFYQFVGGSYTLGISATKKSNQSQTVLISALDVEKIIENNYLLISYQSGNLSGRYLLSGGIDLSVSTTDKNSGTLTITNFDEEKFIISGIFEFAVLDTDGKEIKITDGRFDLNYTN